MAHPDLVTNLENNLDYAEKRIKKKNNIIKLLILVITVLIIGLIFEVKYNSNYYERKYEKQIKALNNKIEQEETKYNDLYLNYKQLNELINGNNE